MVPDNKNKIENLQQLKKKLLELKLIEHINIVLNEFSLGNIYGVFCDDNSFLFVKEKSTLEFNYDLSIFRNLKYLFGLISSGESLVSKKYYLSDFFSRIDVSEKENEKYLDGDIYEYNGKYYYVVLVSKIVPASFMINIPLENVSIIQDKINSILADNPEFVLELLSKENTKQRQNNLILTKTKR